MSCCSRRLELEELLVLEELECPEELLLAEELCWRSCCSTACPRRLDRDAMVGRPAPLPQKPNEAVPLRRESSRCRVSGVTVIGRSRFGVRFPPELRDCRALPSSSRPANW